MKRARLTACVRSLVLFASLPSILLGCGPELLWYGHGSDRTQRLELRERDAQQWLVAGERQSARYEAIATSGFARSAQGSRVAFAAMRRDGAGRERWQVLVELLPGRVWDAVAAMQFDPSGQHVAHLGQRDGRWYAVLDGRPGPGFDAIDADTLAWSPDGARLGYVALDGACARVVIDDHVGACVHAVRGLALGERAAQDLVIVSDATEPAASRVQVGGVTVLAVSQPVLALCTDARRTRWALKLAGDGRGVRARLLGQDGLLAEAEAIGHVVFSADGTTLVYTLREGGQWFAAVAGAAGAGQATATTRSRGYLAIEAPQLSADGRHWGYLGRTARASDVVVDGMLRVRVPTATATALALSPDGKRAAFVHRDAHGPVLVVDREAYRFDVLMEGSLRFDARGQHWAMLVGELSRRELFVVVDGRVRLPFDTTELFGGGLGEGDVGELLGRWVQAELTRFLARGAG